MDTYTENGANARFETLKPEKLINKQTDSPVLLLVQLVRGHPGNITDYN